MKKFLIISLMFLTIACANSKGWVYRANNYDNYTQQKNLQNKVVVVESFSDKRESENKDFINLYMLPLAPYGFMKLNSPETGARHLNSGLWVNFNPKDDFAKALAEELNSARIFKEATFTSSAKDADYQIRGEMISTYYNGKLFSYGLSIYGPLLWAVGFPATTVSNDLEVKLSFIDVKSKNILFTKNYKADNYKKWGWIYSLPNDFNYSDMLKVLYKQFIDDLIAQQDIQLKK